MCMYSFFYLRKLVNKKMIQYKKSLADICLPCSVGQSQAPTIPRRASASNTLPPFLHPQVPTPGGQKLEIQAEVKEKLI